MTRSVFFTLTTRHALGSHPEGTFRHTLRRFQPTKTEARLTDWRRSFYRGSAPPLRAFTDKGFTPLSWLSFSPRVFFYPSPKLVIASVLCVATEKLPTSASVERGSRVFHPIRSLRASPQDPAGGFVRSRERTRFSCTGSTKKVEYVPVAPFQHGTHGIEPEDYSKQWDYSLEPPSNRTSHSRGIRLYGPSALRLMRPHS